LVCRHAECDLHTTTNILATDLAQKCEQGFEPAQFDEDGNLVEAASARCCTSDITVNEYKTLIGKMDAADSSATTVEAYLGGTADFRTDLYATGGTLLTHAESIKLFQRLGRKMTPELKTYDEAKGILTYDAVRQKVVDEYRAAGVPAEDVWLQSFNLPDVQFWIESAPDFGEQAVYLEGRDPVDLVNNPPPLEEFQALKAQGINILAPPMPTLLTTDGNEIVPSEYAIRAREAGLGLISWTIERSGRVNEDIIPSGGAFYYNTTVDVLRNDGDIMRTMDVLVQEVGIFGLFSDWPATTTFYANCKDIPELD
ncbi:MAG: glycerophosphodiester phosphodiesterase, partial [Pseudomonadota bacterium]